jgi:hypothetical protein
MGSFPLTTKLPPRLACVAIDRSQMEGSLIFGGSPMNKITVRCSRSNPFACPSLILLTRSTRCGAPPFASRSRVGRRSFVQKYCKEVILLKRANHPNILSIEGVASKLFEFCMVSQWMPNGRILEYVGKHPGANRLELASLTHWQSGSALTGL